MKSQWLLSVISFCFTSTLITSNVANAFTVNVFTPEEFSDEAVGISGFIIEDFEDTNLIPGLSVEWTNPQVGPFTTLPSVYNNGDRWHTVNNAWDGENFLGNYDKLSSGVLADATILNFSNNPTSVGIGISNYQFLGAKLLINGVTYGDLSELISRRTTNKNAYLRIDAESGEFIRSISIDGRPGDFIGFDRVAVGSSINSQSVPESFSALSYLLIGGFLVNQKVIQES